MDLLYLLYNYYTMQILNVIKENRILQLIVAENLKFNKALSAPYHNFYHQLVVANSCLEAAEYYKLDERPKLELIVAALFHDFNHSMGKYKDDINVELATYYFRCWYAEKNLSNGDLNQGAVVDIIQATQYPYVIEHDKLTLQQKIIRDADLTQLMQANRIGQVYIGLATEMNLPIEAILEGEKAFLESVVPCTEWFLQKWAPAKQNVINECADLLSYVNLIK